MPDLILTQVGPLGVLLLAFIMVFRGALVPKHVYREAIAERDSWREAHRLSEVARAEDSAQTARLLELSEMSSQMLYSIREAALTKGDE